MEKRPNFLFIMTDQHRSDMLGCYGHPVVKTPHIDALAKRGTRFTKFHVASPVCMPNRASFMTGRYPSVHGLRYNGCSLPKRANTFVDVLKHAGYQTASIGKSHLQPFTDLKSPIAPPEDASPVAEAWKREDTGYDLEEPYRYKGAERYDFPTPYYGFDHADMVTGHGDRAGGHYQQWFRETHENWRELEDPANELPHNYSCRQAFRTPIPEDSYPSAYIRDRACDYLRDQADSEAPLFTYVSFPDPHHPFNPPGKYWDMYDPDDFEVPVSYRDHITPPPPLVATHQDYLDGIKPALGTTVFMADDRHIREAMALTAGMITMIDDAVGTLVQVLKDTGQFDNTVIVFNADHGDYLGDSGLMLKGAWQRDTINLVPMVWSDPSGPSGAKSDVLASTVDLSSTVLDRAGLTPYHGMQGKSLMPCMDGVSDLRDDLLVEYNDGLPRMGFESPARVRTIVTRRHRMSVYGGQAWGELYDTKADPQNLNNLWDSPDHTEIKAELLEGLAHLLIKQMDDSPRAKRVA